MVYPNSRDHRGNSQVGQEHGLYDDGRGWCWFGRPQVGKLLRIFVVNTSWHGRAEDADPHIFINPEVEPYTEEADALGPEVDHSKSTPRITSNEGCLSFPGGRGKVERYSSIRVKYLDMDGKLNTLVATDYFARAIQHENDHLDGITIQSSISDLDMRSVRENTKILLRKRVRELKPLRRRLRLTIDEPGCDPVY